MEKLLEKFRRWTGRSEFLDDATQSIEPEPDPSRPRPEYRCYFFDEMDNYNTYVWLYSREELEHFVRRYRTIAPRMMITNRADHSVFEVVSGDVVQNGVLDEVPSSDYPYWLTEPDSLYSLLDVLRQHQSSPPTNLSELETWCRELRWLEADLLAYAAKFTENLFEYGWERSENVIDKCREISNTIR